MVHTRGSQLKKMSNILWILLTLFFNTIPLSEQLTADCCPANTVWLGKQFCSDESIIDLSCALKEHSFHKTNAETDVYDNFTVDYEKFTLTFNYNKDVITRSNFCLINNNEEKAALICFSELSDSNQWKYYLFGIGYLISVSFLILTLIIYGYLPELRNMQDKTMICVMISLTPGYFMLCLVNFNLHFNLCISIAFIIYFSFLTAFFWLNIVSFNIWRTVWFRKFAIKDDSLFVVYCLIGWGFPTCFLIATITTHNTDGGHLKPGFGEITCWFPGGVKIWVYFLGPVALLLVLNIIYLSMTSWRLWQHFEDCSDTKLHTQRAKCMLYIKLGFVMGITWVFEVLSSIESLKSDYFWLPADILNSLQGFIIFILLVATRTKVKILLAKKKPCGISFPKSWTLQVDEKSDNIFLEEIELSRA